MQHSCQLLLEYLPQILPNTEPSRENLSLVAGFAFGILAGECAEDDEWVRVVLEYIREYLRIVSRLDLAERRQLPGALAEVFGRLMEERNDQN